MLSKNVNIFVERYYPVSSRQVRSDDNFAGFSLPLQIQWWGYWGKITNPCISLYCFPVSYNHVPSKMRDEIHFPCPNLENWKLINHFIPRCIIFMRSVIPHPCLDFKFKIHIFKGTSKMTNSTRGDSPRTYFLGWTLALPRVPSYLHSDTWDIFKGTSKMTNSTRGDSPRTYFLGWTLGLPRVPSYLHSDTWDIFKGTSKMTNSTRGDSPRTYFLGWTLGLPRVPSYLHSDTWDINFKSKFLKHLCLKLFDTCDLIWFLHKWVKSL